MDGCPLGLGLVVEDKPTEFSCIEYSQFHDLICMQGKGYGGGFYAFVVFTKISKSRDLDVVASKKCMTWQKQPFFAPKNLTRL